MTCKAKTVVKLRSYISKTHAAVKFALTVSWWDDIVPLLAKSVITVKISCMFIPHGI
jgi:hypothetical protein